MNGFWDGEVNGHWLYLDDESRPIILPCLFARYTSENGLFIKEKHQKNWATNETNTIFEEVEISNNAQYVRQNHLSLFLEWVDSDETSASVSTINHTALPSDLINIYINEYLIEKMSKSELVVGRAVYSLRSYYNFLHLFLGNKYKKFGVKSSHRELARNNSKRGLLVKYLLPATRELLYRNATNLLEKLVLMNGGELGCRTAENQGFLLNDFKSNKQKHKGLLSLFEELEANPNKSEFKYHLSSLYTKYGRSRTLYISRMQLRIMRRYYELERPKSDSDHLFVSNSNRNRGMVISQGFGSETYKKVSGIVRKEMRDNPELYSQYQNIEEASVYHHLRHSFATDIFYEKCRARGKNYESISTESAVYIETARRLGHQVDGKYSLETAKGYIHSCGQRERLIIEVTDG